MLLFSFTTVSKFPTNNVRKEECLWDFFCNSLQFWHMYNQVHHKYVVMLPISMCHNLPFAVSTQFLSNFWRIGLADCPQYSTLTQSNMTLTCFRNVFFSCSRHLHSHINLFREVSFLVYLSRVIYTPTPQKTKKKTQNGFSLTWGNDIWRSIPLQTYYKV